MRTASLLPLLCCGCFLLPKGTPPPAPGPAAPSAAGVWELSDGTTLDISGHPQDFWGVAARPPGAQPPRVLLSAIAYDGRELSLVVLAPDGPETLLAKVSAGGALEGRLANKPIRGQRKSDVPSRALQALDLEPVGRGVLSTGAGESFTALAPGGREIFFSRHDESWGHHALHTARLGDDGKWGQVSVLKISGRGWNDREPALSPDGKELWFSSNRSPDGLGEPGKTQQLWVSDRIPQGGWAEPHRLEAPVNSGADDSGPSLTADGTLYFSSRRPGGLGQADLYRARRNGKGYDAPENLGPNVNGKGDESGPFVSPDERVLVFVSRERPESEGGDDLYVSHREGAGWGKARHLGAPVNSFANDYGPSLSPDGKWLYFTSHRRGNGDLYRVEAGILSP